MDAVQRAPWLEQLGDSDLARLDRGVPQDLDRRPDVLVVGGGIVGVCIALACHQAGLGVTLIERSRLGAGATGGAAGLLQPDAHQGFDPAPFVDLGRTSLEVWRELDAGVEAGVGLRDIDWLGLDPQPPEWLADPPTVAERLDPSEVVRLVPGLVEPLGALRIPRQGRLNPQLAVSRLSAALSQVATGVDARGVTIERDRVVSVSTSAGDFSPGVVVFATGIAPLVEGLDLGLSSNEIKGHLVVTEPAPFRLPGIVVPIATQLEDGRLLTGGTLDVGDTSPSVQPKVTAAITAALCAVLPDAAALKLSHAWCCFRPAHADGLPVIDRVPGTTNAWFSSGHFRTGVLMAPAAARSMARWISSRAAPDEIAFLNASRFEGDRGM